MPVAGGHAPGYGVGMPPVLPGLVVGLVLATLLCLPLARWLGLGVVHTWTLLAALAGILALTLTPSWLALEVGTGGTPTCDLSRIGPAPLATNLHVDDPSLNVLLFVPLGAAIGAVGRGRLRWALLAAGLALPWAIEGTQFLAVGLGRACQAGDVVDNTAGLLLGAGPALAFAAVRRRRRPTTRR